MYVPWAAKQAIIRASAFMLRDAAALELKGQLPCIVPCNEFHPSRSQLITRVMIQVKYNNY